MFFWFILFFLQSEAQNACTDSLKDILEKQYGLEQIAMMNQYSSSLDFLLIMNEVKADYISNVATMYSIPRGNNDGCIELDHDELQYCRFSVPQILDYGGLCLPKTCTYEQLTDQKFYLGLIGVVMDAVPAIQRCNVTEIKNDLGNPNKTLELLSDLVNCQGAERLVDYLVSVINVPLGGMAFQGMKITPTCSNGGDKKRNAEINWDNAIIIVIFTLLGVLVLVATLFHWHYSLKKKMG